MRVITRINDIIACCVDDHKLSTVFQAHIVAVLSLYDGQNPPSIWCIFNHKPSSTNMNTFITIVKKTTRQTEDRLCTVRTTRKTRSPLQYIVFKSEPLSHNSDGIWVWREYCTQYTLSSLYGYLIAIVGVGVLDTGTVRTTTQSYHCR